MLAQLLHSAPGGINGRADQRAAFADGAFVLRAALVGLQSAKYHVLGRRDAPRQRHRFGSGVDPCPARADVDLHQDRYAHAGIGRRGFDGSDLGAVVHTHRDLGNAGQSAQAGQLGCTDDFVRHEYVRDAAPGQDLGLGHLLHALPDRAARHLQFGDDRRFVGLGMRPQFHPSRCQQRGHMVKVIFERVEIDDQRGGVDLVFAHARLGGGGLQHRVPPGRLPSQ